MYRRILILIVGCHLATHQADVTAQPLDLPRNDDRTQAKIQELLPIHIYDKDGKLIPVFPGVTYEEFDEMWTNRIARNNRNRPDRVNISKLEISGDVRQNYVAMDVALTFTVMDVAVENASSKNSTREWVRIPLLFPEAALESIEKIDDCEIITHHDERQGYIVWFRGESSISHAEATIRFWAFCHRRIK